MTKPVALLCSPRPDGVSDTLARIFAEGAADAGADMLMLPLRRYAVAPCIGCGACNRPPHQCVLARPGPAPLEDQAEEVFDLLVSAPLVLIASPIYFYALPAHFKALIDRAQRFWAARAHTRKASAALPQPPVKPVLAGLVAGRPRGEQLFAGSLLTLKYFLAPLDAGIRETRLLRGLENREDLLRRPAVRKSLRAWGHDWGHRLAAQAPAHKDGVSPQAAPDSEHAAQS